MEKNIPIHTNGNNQSTIYGIYVVDFTEKEKFSGSKFNSDYYGGKLKLKPSIKYAQDIVRYRIEEFHFDGIYFDTDR
ncbi:unnamed protein product [Adineta steineri]|uniref:Uncharacterized protein n=1 Tax=Adineta steineri TaxID=433720 RepID=A0A815ESU8_9BILA|nr:unnamed protein product [Adineta steineri]CAF4180596.1 unnamed protein product [Adineta steineri]